MRSSNLLPLPVQSLMGRAVAVDAYTFDASPSINHAAIHFHALYVKQIITGESELLGHNRYLFDEALVNERRVDKQVCTRSSFCTPILHLLLVFPRVYLLLVAGVAVRLVVVTVVVVVVVVALQLVLARALAYPRAGLGVVLRAVGPVFRQAVAVDAAR